jgi:hypothetical protein
MRDHKKLRAYELADAVLTDYSLNNLSSFCNFRWIVCRCLDG